MNGLLAWIGLAVMAGGLVAVIVSLVRKPMNSLLTANSWLAPSARFYVRAFVLVMVLAAAAAVVGRGPPCEQQSATFMASVWWAVDHLENICWTGMGVLLGYVLLLTILYAVLGRYRDQ